MRYTVLIADDSKLQRVIVKENLKDIYDVAEASGGQECLDLVEHSAGKIDAVLLDIVMPGMDGFEVLRRRQEPACGQLKTLWCLFIQMQCICLR